VDISYFPSEKLFAKTNPGDILIALSRQHNSHFAGLRGVKQLWGCGKDTAMAEKDTDLQKIKELIEIMKANDLLEVEIKHGDDKIFLKRCPPQPQQVVVPMVGPQVAPPTVHGGTGVSAPSSQLRAPQQEENLVEIKSPIVGTFYATPSPDSEPYVEVGSHATPQTVLCVIEAMKVMNEIKAETGGTIVEVLVTNGQAVEYGQVLFRIRPD
jgi:acetyl-CoA carboxylase biotin carboxyl carrier protein